MRTEFTPGNSPTLSGTSGVDVHILHVEGGEVLLPSREVMLEGMYARSGADLVITSPEDGKFVVKGFFLSDTPPKLTDGGDTQISGEMAAAFAGPIGLDQYAGQTNAAGASIGQVRSLIGVATVTRADGTVVTLKVGDPLYLDDTIETTAGAQIGLILIDGTALALGEKGELVLDDLVYDPSTKNGKAALSLVSGAAEFVSGSIAKSGQDNMTFKTPVGTIGIRGTKVFAQYDPVTGEITILNRPTGTGANGQPIAGEIVLTLPNGQVIGSITGGDAGWRWNAAQGQTPQQVQFTPAQVQGLVAGVQATVNNLQQIQQQQQNNNNTGTPGGDNSGGQGGGQGNGDGQGGNGNGQGQGNTTTGDAGTATTVTANNVVVTTTTIAPGTTQTTFNIGAALVVTNNVTTANPLGTAGTVIGATPGTTIGTIVTPPSPPPPPPNAVVTVTGGGTVTDQTATAVEFTITRSVNTTNTFTVTYTIGGGTATAGTDYVGGSGTLTFAPNELSKTISVPILTNGRTEEAETFSLTLTGATGGTTIAGGPANVTIAADLDLPTISIGNATALDNVAGTVTLKVTRDGAVYAPSTVSYTTVASGLAQAGSDFTAQTGTVTFAANQKEAFITIPILANSTPLTPANREDDETFTVVLSGATDARITGDTGTVTIGADPALASFSISAVGAGEGGTAMITITRSGALGSTVSVNYAAVNGEATAGSDFTGVSGTATFGPQDLSITIPISITLDDDTEGGESFTVVLSNPTGGFIADGGGSATVNIEADPIPIKIVIGPPATIFGAYADNAYVQIAGPGEQITTDSNLAVSTHTFEAWIRPANMNAGAASGDPQTIASILGTNCMFLTYETNHKIKVKIGVGSDERVLESSVTVGSDAWHHVAYSYNNATGEIKLYIDGVQDTNATYLETDTINFASSDPLTIGGGLTPYQGGVDEVRVWNTVRTPAEINNNFHFQFDTAPSNLLIQHVFENQVAGVYPNAGSGGTAFDISSGGYHSPHDGEKSVIFTGTTHITTDIVGGLPGFTLQANIRLLGTAGIDLPIMSKPTVANGTDDTFEFQLFIDATNHVVLRMGRTDSMVTELISGDPLLPGIAYDISATFNPLMNQIDLYVNGELVDTDSFMGSLRRFGNLPIDIGHINDDSGDQYFNGLINTVRIWGLPIPSMLIDDIDSMGALPDANGLIAHFGFVDGSGTAVTDLSGNGHAATITGGTPIWIFDGPLVTHVFDGMEDLQEDGVASVQFVGAPGTPGATLTYSIASGPSHGTLTITAGGYAIYKPTLNYVGADSFTILLTDSANGTTTQVVNLDIEAVNDRPKIALQTTLPSVVVNDPSPVGYTINSQFGGSFVDPDGSFEGVVVLGYTANPTGQGSWQYSTDGSNWYSFGAINVASTQLFLTKDTLVRFLPDMGYSGNPAGLILKAVDDSYTGSFTVGASTVSIATAGAPFLLSEKSSAIFVQVVPPVEFDGGVDDNWDVAMNWNPDVVPTSTSAVSISGSFSVTLNNGNNTTGANAINSLVMGGTAVLALESATRLTINSSGFVGATSSIDIKGSSRLAGPGTLENHGIINVMGIGYLSLVGELHNYGGEINVGDGSSNSTLFMTEDVSNEAISPGRMTPAGIINILTNSDYDSLFSVTNSSTLTNHGDIILSSEDTDGGNGHTATLDANGGTLINYGIIRA
ncbi:MAG: FecR domain-containing protein, partial [Rhodospirillaceae bacterium]|nr:FecR domain-containing protein [Rhodospirillaceae bacterium]